MLSLKPSALLKKCCVPTLLFSLSIAAISGCKKDHDYTTTPPPSVKEDSTYLIAGVKDITFSTQTDTKILDLVLTPTGTTQSHITLSTEGLPDFVTTSFTTKSGTVPFTTSLTFSNYYAEKGDYTITLKGTSDEGVIKTIKMKVTVPQYSCGAKLSVDAHDYVAYPKNGSSSVLIDKPKFINDSLEFSLKDTNPNYESTIQHVRAGVDCNGTITIPNQTMHSYTVWGTGTFNYTDKSVKISYTVADPAGNTYYDLIGKIY